MDIEDRGSTLVVSQKVIGKLGFRQEMRFIFGPIKCELR